MKLILATLCALLFVAASDQKQAEFTPRFDVRPSDVEFWFERKGSITLQLDGSSSVRLENFMRENQNKTIYFFMGDVQMASYIARKPVATGNLVFSMDDEPRAKAVALLPSDRQQE